MKTFSIIFNITQLVAIVFLIVAKGFTLGFLVICVLVVFFAFALFNLLALMQLKRAKQEINEDPTTKILKRQALRVSYKATTKKPLLETKQGRYQIIDISEEAVRFIKGKVTPIKNKMKGHIDLFCGERVNVKGEIKRSHGNEAVLFFKIPIAYAILDIELNFVRELTHPKK